MKLENIKRKICSMSASAVMLAVVALSGCSNDECLDNKNSLPLAGFYSSTTTPASISLDSISIYGIGAPGDSVLHDSVRGLSQSYLPFRIDEGTTRYVIRYLSGLLGRYGIADTITFEYDPVPFFRARHVG